MENSLLLLGLFADTVDANKGMVVRKAAAGVASRKVLEARRNATLVLLATNIWFCCESVLMRTLLAEAVQEDRRSQIANRKSQIATAIAVCDFALGILFHDSRLHRAL